MTKAMAIDGINDDYSSSMMQLKYSYVSWGQIRVGTGVTGKLSPHSQPHLKAALQLHEIGALLLTLAMSHGQKMH